jgi:hypothetical protein
LLSEFRDRKTAWHVAAKKAKTTLLGKLYEWSEKAKFNLKK